jgi:hypothetical protein
LISFGDGKWRDTMYRIRSVLLSLLAVVVLAGCASAGSTAARQDTAGDANRGLVGAWLVTASRPGGQGVVLLTFTSDGTFFRSGDTHPVLSVAHGAWKRMSDREFDATYIALRFAEDRKFVGTQKTRIRITQGPGENEFTGVAKVSILDLNGKEERASETRLAGKRIQVEPF